MKRCPECRRDYYDDKLNFCLEDGAWLVPEAGFSDSPTEVIPHSFSSEPQTMMFGNTSQAARTQSRQAGNSIAVLPFAHLSSDADDEYFCDGLAEELINALAKIDGLKVAARTSAFSFKGMNVDIGHIGRTLGVEMVLEGSVRKSGSRMRVTAQLIGTTDGYHLWSERYDREMRDIFEIQDEITRAVIDALRAKLFGDTTSGEFSELVNDLKHYRTDVEAYQRDLKGRFFLNKFTHENFYRALDLFNEALAVDPNYALAYAGVADSYIVLTNLGPLPPDEAMPKAREAALKALRSMTLFRRRTTRSALLCAIMTGILRALNRSSAVVSNSIRITPIRVRCTLFCFPSLEGLVRRTTNIKKPSIWIPCRS